MEHAKNFHRFGAHAIGDDVRSAGNCQLASARYSTGAAEGGMLSETIDRHRYPCDHTARSGWVIAGDVLSFLYKILKRCSQPPNAHAESVF